MTFEAPGFCDWGQRSKSRASQGPISPFERLQVGDQVFDLGHVQLELRHPRMRRHDALGERLREILDRIAQMKREKERRSRNRALPGGADRMAGSTIGLGEFQSIADSRLLGLRRS